MARVLAIDPGETVGWVLGEGDEIVDGGQTPLWEFIDQVWEGAGLHDDCRHAAGPFADGVLGPELIVCEDWALYPWMAKSLSWDKCRTARGIGAIELIARQAHIDLVLQPAKIKEAAVAAGAEDLFVSPLHENRHRNDAAMHFIYYLAHSGRTRASG